jgi:hypothetical protein
MFADLKNAIVDVLNSTSSVHDDGSPAGEKLFVVDIDKLRILQAEANIHFVEPEDNQIEIV